MTVWHHHVHVFPRWEDDDFHSTNGDWADPGELARCADDLRRAWPAG